TGRQLRREPALEGPKRHDRNVCRRLRWSGTEQRIERLEEDVGGGHKRDPAYPVGLLGGAGPRSQLHDVARLDLQSRGELLVEDDPAWLQAPAQEPERVQPIEVVRRPGKD